MRNHLIPSASGFQNLCWWVNLQGATQRTVEAVQLGLPLHNTSVDINTSVVYSFVK